SVELVQVAVAYAPQELRIGAVPGTQLVELRPRTDDLDRPARPPRGLERDVDALVAHELGHHEQEVLGPTAREALDLNRGVDHGRVAPPVPADPLLGELGVRDVVGDAGGP